MGDYELTYGHESDPGAFLTARSLEWAVEYDPEYYTHIRQVVARIVGAVDCALPLSVQRASSTTFNVRGGRYRFAGTEKTYTPSTAVDPTDSDTTYVWIADDNTIGSAIDGTGWPATPHIKLAELVVDSDGVITSITDRRSVVKSGTVVDSGITTGGVHCKRIASAELEALLDTGENNLFALKAGDIILKLVFNVGTAAGGACTVNIGLDADADGSSKDVDGFLVAADANAAGQYSTEDDTYDGAYVNPGPKAADDDGYAIIQSSSDQSSSSFVGGAYMLYIPANAD